MGFLKEILSNLRSVIDAVPNPQNVHLLYLVVKKVLVQVLVQRKKDSLHLGSLFDVVAPRGLEPLLPP